MPPRNKPKLKEAGPVRPGEAARLVFQKMKENEAAHGFVSEKHVAWLLEFTKYLFKCPRSAMALDPSETIILLCPILSASEPDANYTTEQWDAAINTFDVLRHQKDLPKITGLSTYTIEFIREIPPT